MTFLDLNGGPLEEKTWCPKSINLDRVTIGEVTLTLGSWQPQPYFSPSYEIGWRCGERFELIQFRMQRMKAWYVVKELVKKGKCPFKIIAVLERLDY